MGRHLLPVSSNFPMPGHRVRHTPLAAGICSPILRPVGMTMSAHDATENVAVAQTVKRHLDWVSAANR